MKGENTLLFYFTATGNSLYVAKQLENDPISIPQELRKANRHYISDSIGIVCPLFEFEIPKLVKDFIQGSSFETDYFYLLITPITFIFSSRMGAIMAAWRNAHRPGWNPLAGKRTM